MGNAGYKGGPQEVTINPDTLPLPIEITNSDITDFTSYLEELAVPITTRTLVISESFVADAFEKCTRIEVSGEVFAEWELELNGAIIDKRRTTPELNEEFNFLAAPKQLSGGDTLEIFVTHFTTGNFNFNSTIHGTSA